MITVDRLEPSDRAAWEALFHAYIDFDQRAEPPQMYERAWREFSQGTVLHALGARLDARGQGAARALIAAVTDWARARGCCRVYWNAHDSNRTARSLYDTVAENRGFIRYQIELPS